MQFDLISPLKPTKDTRDNEFKVAQSRETSLPRMSQFLPHGFTAMHHAAMVGNTSLAEKLVEENPLLLFCVSNANYLPIHLALFTRHFKTFVFLLKASQDHIYKCKLKENHSPFEGIHGAVLLNCVIDAGLLEVAYVLIKASDGIGTTKYENVKHALAKTVENFDLYSRQPKESRNLDQSLAKKLQLELRDTVDQGELSSRFESEPLSDEVQDFPECEVIHHIPLLLLRTLCNQLRKKYTLFNSRYIFMEAAVLSVRLDIEEALNELTLHFPDAIMIKHEGHHLIEAAVSYGSKKVVKFWTNKNYNTAFNLLDLQSDPDNNNVLHHAAMLAPREEANKKSNAALRLQKEVMWFKNVESLLHPMYAEAKNKNGETPMMVFTREHEELRKQAEKLMMREAKVSIVVAMLIVVVLIAAFIKFMEDDDNILTKTKMFFGMWGTSIYLTAAIPLINSLPIIISRFRVEDFKRLPSNKNYGMRMLLFSLASMMLACVTLFASAIWDGFGPVQSNQLHWVQNVIQCYAGPNCNLNPFFPTCVLSKLKIL